MAMKGLNYIRHKNKQKLQYEVEIVLHTLLNLPRSCQSLVYITWKRGKRNGESGKADPQNKTAEWEHSNQFTFPCVVYHDNSNDSMEKKILTLTAHSEGSSKKGSILGQGELNIASYVEQLGTESTRSFPLTLVMHNKHEKTPSDKHKESLKLRLTMKLHKSEVGLLSPRGISVNTPPVTPQRERYESPTVYKLLEKPAPESPKPREIEVTKPAPFQMNNDDDDDESLSELVPKKPSSSPTSSSGKRVPPRNWMRKENMELRASDTELLRRSKSYQKLSDTSIPKSPRQMREQLKLELEGFRKAHRRNPSDSPPLSPKIRLSQSLHLEREDVEKEEAEQETDNKEEKVENDVSKLAQELAALKSLQQQQENENFLIENLIYFMEPQYSNEVSVSGYAIFRALIYWRAFDKNSKLLDKLSEAFEKVAHKDRQNVPLLLYWLSTTSILLYLLRTELQFISSDSLADPTPNSSVSFMDKIRSFTHTFYSSLLDNIVEEAEPILITAVLEQSLEPAARSTEKASVEMLASMLLKYSTMFDNNYIFPSLKEQFFKQLISTFCERLFNCLLHRKELVTFGNGLQIKMQLNALEELIARSKSSILITALKELTLVKQVADVLIMNKTCLAEPKTRDEVCPLINHTQLKYILQLYSPDEFDKEPVHPGVLSSLSPSPTDVLQMDAHQKYSLDIRWNSTLTHNFNEFVFPSTITQRKGFEFLVQGTRSE